LTRTQIAGASGFSPKTVVAAFTSKRGILSALVDPLLPPTLSAELLDELRSAGEPLQRLALAAQLTRRVYEATAPELDLLRAGGLIAPELEETARQVSARRRENQSRLVSFLLQRQRLRAGIGPEEALDVLWALTSYELFRLLVRDCGWRLERYEAWLTEILAERLLEPA